MGAPRGRRTPLWDWRKLARSGGQPAGGAEPSQPSAPTQAAPRPTSTTGGFTCGTKTYGRQMSTCAEARFHLSQCGLARLDSNGDGVPCESLCR